MAPNAEPSFTQKPPNLAPNIPKPPNITQSLPNTPNTQSTPLPDTQKTPTQSTGKRHHGYNEATQAEGRRFTPYPPPRSNTQSSATQPDPTQPIHHPQIDPFNLSPEPSQEPDQVMQDLFTGTYNPPQARWDKEERYYDCLHKIQSSLKTLHSELEFARKEEMLSMVLEDEETDEYLTRLSILLPSYTTNAHINPVMKGIADLQAMMHQMNNQLQKPGTQSGPPQGNKTLYSSIHAAPNHPPLPATSPSPSPLPKRTTNPPQLSPTNKHKTQGQQIQAPKTPINPNSSHHPSRLVAQFVPRGVPEDQRPDPSMIVTQVNASLASNEASKHLKVVAASFNTQGNLILSTRADQAASELLRFRDTIAPLLAHINNSSEVQLREDKKWYKIQVDAVSTSTISITNERILLSPEAVHEELLACNPQYTQLLNSDSLAAKPRWLRSTEELATTPRSSVVFATTDEAAARSILKQKSLAAFGRHCTIRAFQDRPPITQCRKCWRLDHTSHQCKEVARCRLCSAMHSEADHHFTDPSECQICSTLAEMGGHMDMAEGHCPHDIRCINCLGKDNREQNHTADARRCPTRLEKYGTARENERRALKSDNPWIRAKTRKPKQKTVTVSPPSTQADKSSANRFNTLEPPPTPTIRLSQANALNTPNTQP